MASDAPYNVVKNALYFEYGLSDNVIWCCYKCHCHVVLHDGVLAANRYTARGRALLCGDIINIKCGEHELVDLDLGMHAVARVWCARCQSQLGVKILRVPSAALETTAGKYLLDCSALVRQDS